MSFVERRKFLWILLFVALGLLAVVANATTLVRLRFEELARQATAVARVRCLSAQSFWESGEIWTDTRFAVLEQQKGYLPQIITVRMPGGSVGGLHSRIEEVPAFRASEEAYVFLWAREGEPLRVLGWSQGTFRVARDARTGAETVTQDSEASPIFDPATRQFRHSGIRNLPLTTFQTKLKKALEGNAP